MYSQLYSPCLFQQLPVFHEKTILRQAPLFQDFANNKCNSNDRVILTTKESSKGVLLTFQKQLPYNKYYQAIEEQYHNIKQTIKPTYRIVTDFFGNQYYVANQIDEQAVLDQIDCNAVGRKLAKEMFQDYSLELSHDGSKLVVCSSRDNINEKLQFNSFISDFQVVGCGVINENTAVLKIDVIFETKKELLEAQYQKEEQEDEKKRLAEIKETERISRLEQERIRKQKEAERIALEKERREKSESTMKLKAKQELEKKLALEKEQKEQERREEELKRKQEEERRIKREKTLQEHIEYQRSLVEEERRRKQEKLQQESLLASKLDAMVSDSNNVVNININFHNENDNDISGYESSAVESAVSDSEDSETSISHSLRRYSSPVLEEVEDDEMSRYNESLIKSPRGTSIIEDA